MRKILVFMFLLLITLQSTCLAKIEKGSDSFDGTYWYHVDYTYSPPILSLESYTIDSGFGISFAPDIPQGTNYYYLSFRQDSTYFIGNTIKMNIDNIVYTWTTAANSSRGNDFVTRTFPLPTNVYDAILKTTKPITVRFSYEDTSGSYSKDYVIPYKNIKDVQTMYSTYTPPTPTKAAQ